MEKITDFIETQGIFLSWIVAFIATLGSLFFSEIMGFTPCLLCWYQRILMYPLSIILLIATIRNDRHISIYVFPLALIGLLTSGYHYIIQKMPTAELGACGIIPCTTQYINWFGFITIPFLAFVAFTIIASIHIFIWIRSKGESIS
jgi:disulfide bond formation protein DsbB